MKVLLSATNLSSSNRGGALTFVTDLAKGLANYTDIRLGILLPSDMLDLPGRMALPGAIDIVPIRALPSAARIPRDLFGLDATVRSWSPQVFHFPHEWTPRVAVPTVLTLQNIGWLHRDSRVEFGHRGAILRALSARTFSADRRVWTAVSEVAAKAFAEHLRVPPSFFEIIPEGIWAEDFTMTSDAQEDYVLLIAGTVPYKNLVAGLKAYELLHRRGVTFDLHIAGIGPDQVPWRTIPEGLRPRVRARGWMTRASLLNEMARARACLFPSRVESFGLPALESTASGTRCVVLRGSAMSEWLGDNVIEADDKPLDLAAAVLRAIDSLPPDRKAVLERFGWAKIAPVWAELYERLKHSG